MVEKFKGTSKVINTVYSCKTIEHTTTVYNWATRLRDDDYLTEPEYCMILEAVNEVQNKIKRESHKNLFM